MAQRGTAKPRNLAVFPAIPAGTRVAVRTPMNALARFALFLGAASLVCACGGSTDSGNTGGASGAGGAGGTSTGGSSGGGAGGASGSGGAGGSCESFTPCCDASGHPVTPICVVPNQPECPPGSSWPATGTCSANPGACSPSLPCASAEYCDYPDNRCGAGASGTCVKRPQGCDLLYAPVCTCEGKQAGNDCAAYSGGTDVNQAGGCTPPQGMFPCGYQFCSVGSQYCQVATSDVGGEPNNYTCKQLPAGCGANPGCGCVANESCGSWCALDGSGNLTLTCPGG